MTRPRRSVLYMPGANTRAMEKAKSLDCDTVVFDLEDAVAPAAKAQARQQVAEVVQQGGYGYREIIVRCNGLDTEWGAQDIAELAALNIDGMLFPKIQSRSQVDDIVEKVNQAGAQELPVWVMVETPQGVMDLAAFADHPRVAALVMGTSDLVKELRAVHEPSRLNIAFALQSSLLVARRFGKEIFDGVHLDFKDSASFHQACLNGREMGFDGKTLIHPSQIDIANEVFGYSEADINEAKRLLNVWEEALQAGKGVAVLDGKLVENLHAEEAQRVVAFAQAIAARDT
ncbi:MAG: CoA ester lyase [Pseudomonadaceae bacterium]|nr:CoA ester lyase [Pseudomonadaceae bacterium]